MIRPRLVLAAALAGSVTLAAAPPLLVQETESGMQMEMEQPTQEHQMLQKAVGQWEGTVTLHVPGMPQTPSPATESVRSGGPFWTISDFNSQFLGQSYAGHGCHGYDAKKKKFVSTWTDNMSSFLTVMEGEHEADQNTIVYTWEAPDMTGQMAPHRADYETNGDDAYTMTFYTNGEKTMVIEMERTSSQPVDTGAR